MCEPEVVAMAVPKGDQARCLMFGGVTDGRASSEKIVGFSALKAVAKASFFDGLLRCGAGIAAITTWKPGLASKLRWLMSVLPFEPVSPIPCAVNACQK